MIHPGGTFRMVWNILVALCLVHDLVVIPLYVFDIPDSAVLITLEWCTQLFWNFDILLSMHTGYYYKGLLIMSARKVFRNYVRTWMALDVTLVSLDWIFVILEVSGIQITSAAWLVRILRWVKLRRMAEMFQELIQSQSAGMYWSLVFGIARLLILNHLVACAWFGLSRIQGEVNWVEAHGLTDKSSLHKYWTCLNWAFAQLGVGLSDITPRTTTETFFSVLIAFRSLITCTTLISRMTSLMTALIKTKEDEEREFRLLRSYLVYNEIPHSLGQKVTRDSARTGRTAGQRWDKRMCLKPRPVEDRMVRMCRPPKWLHVHMWRLPKGESQTKPHKNTPAWRSMIARRSVVSSCPEPDQSSKGKRNPSRPRLWLSLLLLLVHGWVGG
ncbi:unnamed protein product [Durusdinium trenchii]|uniref:Ion transport domain-containing protein n=1 Tax=Durusdinium trenchii TaxID=1381693 RepID=A0ABP0QHF0_9DINO